MRTLLIASGIASLLAAVMLWNTGCGITIPQGAIDAGLAALTNTPPAVVPPAGDNGAQGQADAPVAHSDVRCNPTGVNQAYMDTNPGEECQIEPDTGLMIRALVWCYCDGRGEWGWWALSSVAKGHIKLVNENLVFTDYAKDGVAFVCRGYASYEPQWNEVTPRLCATGTACPYDGSRRYVLLDSWQQ